MNQLGRNIWLRPNIRHSKNLGIMKKNHIFLIFPFMTMLTIMSFTNISKVGEHGIPLLITTAPYDISSATITCGGCIFNDGGSPIIKRGVCWSTSQYPTIYTANILYATRVDDFTLCINSLEANTNYYVRAFATNFSGTAYGRQIMTTTMSSVNFNNKTQRFEMPAVLKGEDIRSVNPEKVRWPV